MSLLHKVAYTQEVVKDIINTQYLAAQNQVMRVSYIDSINGRRLTECSERLSTTNALWYLFSTYVLKSSPVEVNLAFRVSRLIK